MLSATTKSTIPLPTRERSEEELLRDGWERRFVAGPARLKEAVELYESMGYEVHLEPLGPEELQDQCQDCRLAIAFFRVIYTRPRSDELG